jgi:hypothetical protein
MTTQVRRLYEAHDIAIHLVQEVDVSGIQQAVNWVRSRTIPATAAPAPVA